MPGMKRSRFLLVTGGVAALVALLLLSGTLSQMRLAPGNQLPSVAQEAEQAEPQAGAAPAMLDDATIELFWTIAQALNLLLLAAAIVALIVSPEMRKQTLARMILPALILVYVLLIRDKSYVPLPPPTAVPAEPGSGVVAESGPVVEFDANPPKTVVWGTRIAVGAATGLVVGGAIWLLWRSRRSPGPHPLAQVAEQARKAIQEIEAGGDIRNVVLRCYFEMSRVLGEEKGLTRQATMTPREFERGLVAAGLPGPSVQRLTRLFEAVRYGAQLTGDDEEQQAMTALSAIVQACRSEA